MTTFPFPILQPGIGEIPGDHYLRSTPDTVMWGRLPCVTDTAVLEVASGETVTIDTVSHEGILDDHGTRLRTSAVTAFPARRCSTTPSRWPRRCRETPTPMARMS